MKAVRQVITSDRVPNLQMRFVGSHSTSEKEWVGLGVKGAFNWIDNYKKHTEENSNVV